MRGLISVLIILIVGGCGQSSKHDEHLANSSVIEEQFDLVQEKVKLSDVFKGIPGSFGGNDIVLPEGVSYNLVFSEEKDVVLWSDRKTYPSKGNHDMLALIEAGDGKGKLFVSHETKYHHKLGDGGGATFMDLVKKDGNWCVDGGFRAVDFSRVGNTDRNCGGQLGPDGMIYSCEEYATSRNGSLFRSGKGHLDTIDINGRRYCDNIGYVVQIDPATEEVVQKMYGMGKYFHEDIEFLDDSVTVFLSDDYWPAVFFKFVADEPLEYEKGQLYAYSESTLESGGHWIELPRDTSSMINVRDIAISKGATMFLNHEWIARYDDYILISEGGEDNVQWSERLAQGGVPASYLKKYTDEEGVIRDYHGRLLKLDLKTDELSVFLEGGVSAESDVVFSNPDCIVTGNFKGVDVLLIHEDIHNVTYNRVPDSIASKNQYYNELYLLDLGIEFPKLEDLKRFAVTPMGAEFTGGVFDSIGENLFINVQHPFWTNKEPFKRSSTIVISGWND